jgi:prepilin-type N-terminal cleavage/methylation domain-containing protein
MHPHLRHPPPATTRRRRAGRRGHTLPELIAVLVLIGVLAVVALPKFDGALGFRDEAWRDALLDALREAHQTAVAHRRLVCVSVSSSSVSLSIAAANPAGSCGSALPGPDGQANFASGSGAATSLSPAGTLYFQPSGRVTTDAAGNTAGQWTLSIAGLSPITLLGETGHVE